MSFPSGGKGKILSAPYPVILSPSTELRTGLSKDRPGGGAAGRSSVLRQAQYERYLNRSSVLRQAQYERYLNRSSVLRHGLSWARRRPGVCTISVISFDFAYWWTESPLHV